VFVLKTVAHFIGFDAHMTIMVNQATNGLLTAMILTLDEDGERALSHSTITVTVTGHNIVPNRHPGGMGLYCTEFLVQVCVSGEQGEKAVIRKKTVYHFKPSIGVGSSFLSLSADGQAEPTGTVFEGLFG